MRWAGYLGEELSQADVEPHQVPRVGGDDVHVLAANVLGRGTHRRFDRFPRCVHEEFDEPFEDQLDLLRIGLLKVCGGEGNTDVADTSGDLSIWLGFLSECAERPVSL